MWLTCKRCHRLYPSEQSLKNHMTVHYIEDRGAKMGMSRAIRFTNVRTMAPGEFQALDRSSQDIETER